MPSTSTLLLLAAAGYGAYIVLKPKEMEKEVSTWVEPKHDSRPDMTNFIKPDDPPVRDTFTDQQGAVINPQKYKPGSFMDRYVKKRGAPPGW